MVRAGRAGQHEAPALKSGCVLLGFPRVPDLTSSETKAEIAKVLRRVHPDATPSRIGNWAAQLYAFRTRMQKGDLVVMPRKSVSAIAIGEITGDYRYLGSPTEIDGAAHSRSVRWLRDDIPRTTIGKDLLNSLGAIMTVCRIARNDAAVRIRHLADHGEDPGVIDARTSGAMAGEQDDETGAGAATDAFDQLRTNLEYARSLARAGVDLERLGVTAFEVTDVYRAAWMQCVAALDHWVHQEVHRRMIELAAQPDAAKPDRYRKFNITMEVLERVHQRREPLDEVLGHYVRDVLGRETYQQPDRIRDAFSLVSDVDRLWERVATELSDQSADEVRIDASAIKQRLRDVVYRRNKIAHEYDEDLTSPDGRQPIDATTVADTIDWIELLAETILVVVDRR